MKDNIKKLLLMVAAFAAIVGIFVTNNTKNTFAESNKSVNIHYLRDDGAYSKYVIALWDENTEGKDYNFAINGNEAIATYNCSSDDTTVVMFVIKAVGDATPDVVTNRKIDVENLSGSMDIYVKAGVAEYSLEAFDNNKTEETTTSEEQETTVQPVANKSVDNSKKDYSVSTGMVIISDVIFLIIVAGGSYLICSKKK